MNTDLMYIICNYDKASKILQRAKKCGVKGGTILKARGTVNNFIARLLSLHEEKKELLLIATQNDIAKESLKILNEEFCFYKKNKGIAFRTKIFVDNIERKEESMYHVIFTIVNKSNGEDVIEAAKKAGSKGGTIINARGSGIHETEKIFNIEIEPEKEIVMIIADKKDSKNIVESIKENLEIEKPGNGIIFVQEALDVYGIYE